MKHKMFGYALVNSGLIIIARWAMLISIRLDAPLANKPFGNKGPTVVQPLTAQNPGQLSSKLESSLY